MNSQDSASIRVGSRERTRRAGYVVGVVLLLAVLAGLAQYLGNSTSPLPSPQGIPSAAGLYPAALSLAEAWWPDAYLTGITVDVEPSPRVAFAFNTTSDRSIWLLVYAKDAVGGPLLSSKEGRAEGRTEAKPPLERAQWPLDSREVFAIALENGAAEFLRQ